MRLSMWILADWLKEYKPTAKIQDGDRILRNVRQFSDDLIPSRSTVYLNKIDNHSVMCANGHDILVLQSDDIIEVFNKILDAFDYYNEWESRILDLIDRKCTLEEVLEEGSSVIKSFMILADASYYVYATYGDLNWFGDNEDLRNSLKNQLLPVETLLKLELMPGARDVSSKPFISPVEVTHLYPSVSNVFINNMHQGWFVITNPENRFIQADLDFQDAFSKLIGLWLEANQSDLGQKEKAGMFLDILSGTATSDKKIYERLEVFEWYRDDPKIVYSIKQNIPDKNNFHVLEKHLERITPNAFLLHFNGEVLFIVNRNLIKKSFMNDFTNLLVKCGCVAGESPEFTNVMGLPEVYQAAHIAAESAVEQNKTVVNFNSICMDYILNVLKDHTALNIIHPALTLLETYDKEHQTDFYRTLDIFLDTNCNLAETARLLYIHRSTLQYRLEKIQNLTQIDPMDKKTRLHLMLSYLMKQNHQPSKN